MILVLCEFMYDIIYIIQRGRKKIMYVLTEKEREKECVCVCVCEYRKKRKERERKRVRVSVYAGLAKRFDRQTSQVFILYS